MRNRVKSLHQEYVRKHRGKLIDVDKMPYREVLIKYLETCGYQIVDGRSEKYLTMAKPGVEKKYFVGTNGGCKYGRNISSANSIYRSESKEWAVRAKVKERISKDSKTIYL